ncbi:MAG: lysine--tRNA ligase [SAR324 cluster bacterium]|nr:lysine--tRNA ligase [SAR324 cluster bacterium]
MKQDFWPVTQANNILKRLAKNQDTIILETGYGPSGLPHIGTFAEVARSNFVMMALKELAPELKLELIAFSDDRDGLRKIPPTIPNPDILKNHLGKPLSKIPDPFQKYSSFADYMNNQLCEFLDSFNFTYTYVSATKFYESGRMDEVLLKITDNYQEIKDLFIKTIHQDKRENWSPFLPICQKCGRLYTTRVTQVDAKLYQLEYSCDQGNSDQSPACQHKGKMEINGANIKLGWKVDWAARWYTLNVDYEMHGEDLIESARISQKICRILGKPAPLTYKYELFLDENGQKISKTKGNGVTIEEWINYSPFNGLLHFILANPAKPKKMGLDIIPRLVDEYLSAENKASTLDLYHPLWYIKGFNNYDASKVKQYPSYQLLANIAESLGEHDVQLLLDYSQKYQPEITIDEDFINFCQKVSQFVRHTSHKNKKDISINQDPALLDNLKKWQSYLQSLASNSVNPENAQKQLFSLAKENNLPMKIWFKFLYNVYLNKDAGPKLGQYFAILGKNKSLELTDIAIKKATIH